MSKDDSVERSRATYVDRRVDLEGCSCFGFLTVCVLCLTYLIVFWWKMNQ